VAGEFTLDRLVGAVQSVGGEESRSRLSQALGRTMLGLIRQQIDTGVDCYGDAMPPRKGDGALPLQGLRNAFTASYTSQGPVVGTSKWYAAVHQTGKVIKAVNKPMLRFRLPGGMWASAKEVTIPRRQLVPSRERGLGPVWDTALKEAANRWVRDHLSRALQLVGQ
jgi:phage gpG-like protein